jgi:glucose-6-phosphate isomerase
MSKTEAAQLAPHKVIQGNKPSTTITIPEVDAFTVGQLIAMYEQRIFVQGVIWNLNSFDQWGVELGKQMCSSILPLLEGDSDTGALSLDPSTAQLVDAARAANS